MRYLFHLLIYLDIYVIVALSLNIIVGYTGLLNLAHAGYFALGSYCYAIITLKFGWEFFPVLMLSILIAAVASLAISLPAWRFRGDLFVISSLTVQSLLFSAFYNWFNPDAQLGSWRNLTNGPNGIAGIRKPVILGTQLDTIGGMVVLATCLALGCALVTWLLLSSPWGRLLKAMRDDELAARGLGKNVRLAKVQAFAFACGLVAVAGVIHSSYSSYINPSLASLDESLLMLCMVLVGGVGNFRGPLIGAAVLIAVPELLRFAELPQAAAANIRMLAYGLILIVLMHFRPQGLAGQYRLR
jgi:branched-chain amino acid transport system permease protein